MPSLTRRNILTLLATSCSLSTGCLEQSQSDVAYSQPPITPTQGEANPLSVQQTITDPTVEYLPETNNVQYISGYRAVNQSEIEQGHTPEPEYDTIPFTQWAIGQCAMIGAHAITDHIQTYLDEKELDIGASVRYDQTGPTHLSVNLETIHNRAGDVINRPNLDFKTVTGVTPSRVTATILLGDQSHTSEFPVKVAFRNVYHT